MEFDHRHRLAATRQPATADLPTPGKHTRAEQLPVQRREMAPPGAASAAQPAAPSMPVPASAAATSRSPLNLQMLFGRHATGPAVPVEPSAPVYDAAARGTATPVSKLPHADPIQRAFGRHDVSGIQAHVGPEAAASARQIGARAYATGDHVVLGDDADLHTVAHEAAHVIQQRSGVHLAGGVGQVGDRYEQHADEVAALVVQGRSAEALLDAHAPGGGPRGDAPSGSPQGGGAVQRKWSRMSTRIDATDDADVNQIANLAGQANYVGAFRATLNSIPSGAALLARFNAAVTVYTAVGQLPRITAALQATYAAPGKAYAAWEVLDEVEGGAADQLERMFAARRVIVAGETHGDPVSAAIETTLLPAHNIQVRYESEAIQAPGGAVMPDPPAYRLLYMIEDFYVQLRDRRTYHADSRARAGYLSAMDAAYNRYQSEFNNYSQPAIEQSLDYEGQDLTSYDRLNQLRTILYNTLELIESRPNDASVYDRPVIANNAPRMFDLFRNLKQASGHASNEPVMRKLRSDRMLATLQADLAGAARTVYKVGNNHVADMRARANNLAWVLDEVQYKAIFRL